MLAHPEASADNRGSAANNADLIALVHGDYPESLRHIEQAEDLADEVGPSPRAFAAHNRGLALAQMGRLAEALRELDRATGLLEQKGVPLGEHYIEYAEVLTHLRLAPEAQRLAERAVADLDAHGAGLMAAEARLSAAEAALLASDPGAASTLAAQVRDQFRRQRRTAWAARATVVEARAALAGRTVSREQLTRVRRAAAVLDRDRMPAIAAEAHLVSGLLAGPRADRRPADRARAGAPLPLTARVDGQPCAEIVAIATISAHGRASASPG